MDESTFQGMAVFAIIFCALQIILFFKLWGMTNNVSDILEIMNRRDFKDLKLPKETTVKSTGQTVEPVGMNNGKVVCRDKDNNRIEVEVSDLEICQYE